MSKFKIGDKVMLLVEGIQREELHKACGIIIDFHHTNLMKIRFIDGVELDFSGDDEDIYKLEDLEEYTKDIKFDL